MFESILIWGLAAGLAHFFIIGLLYGNPFIDRIYANAPAQFASVKKWESKPQYLLTQFLGTQIEVFILTGAYFLFRSLIHEPNTAVLLTSWLLLSLVRIYPRFWNMWIQTTYPGKLLAIEFLNGAIGTIVILSFLEKFAL